MRLIFVYLYELTTCPIPKQRETVMWVVVQLEHSCDSYPIHKPAISFKLFASRTMASETRFMDQNESLAMESPDPLPTTNVFTRVSNSVGLAALPNEIYSRRCIQYRLLQVRKKTGLITTDVSRYRRFRRPVHLCGKCSCHISGNAFNFTIG